MDINLTIFLYYVLIGLFLAFLIISIFYLFNRKVLSKLSLSLKLSVYISIYSLALMLTEFYLLDYFNSLILEENLQYLYLAGVFLAYILLCFFTFYINLYPLKKIEKSTKKLADGSKNTKIAVEGSKEFDKIQLNLNALEENNIENDEYEQRMKREYHKFVPKEFFEHLGKKDVFDLKLGESVQKDVAVLFIDIRHSYKTSETLSLEDNFKFINSYLSIVGEKVRNNNGFIDKFLGDGVLAVFLSEADALNCSTEISNCFENMNLVGVNEDKIRFGIGIHSGKVVIGVVGEKERQNLTIISDSVNLASKIENLNKIFKSNILFTKEVLNNLPRNFEINYRYVGTVSIDNFGVSLFENLDGYVGANKTAYLKTKNIFENAVRSFEEKEYNKARTLLINVLKENEDDNLAKFYLKKCKFK